MNICSVIIQNKRGQNIFVVSANDYSHETSLQQSKDIYNYILSQLSIAFPLIQRPARKSIAKSYSTLSTLASALSPKKYPLILPSRLSS